MKTGSIVWLNLNGPLDIQKSVNSITRKKSRKTIPKSISQKRRRCTLKKKKYLFDQLTNKKMEKYKLVQFILYIKKNYYLKRFKNKNIIKYILARQEQFLNKQSTKKLINYIYKNRFFSACSVLGFTKLLK